MRSKAIYNVQRDMSTSHLSSLVGKNGDEFSVILSVSTKGGNVNFDEFLSLSYEEIERELAQQSHTIHEIMDDVADKYWAPISIQMQQLNVAKRFKVYETLVMAGNAEQRDSETMIRQMKRGINGMGIHRMENGQMYQSFSTSRSASNGNASNMILVTMLEGDVQFEQFTNLSIDEIDEERERLEKEACEILNEHIERRLSPICYRRQRLLAAKEWKEIEAFVEKAKRGETEGRNREDPYCPFYTLSNKWIETLRAEHNQWFHKGNYGFLMGYGILQQTNNKYRADWYIATNSPVHVVTHQGELISVKSGMKTCATREEAQKYIDGRIKVYAHLIGDLHPIIPKEYESLFMYRGKPLPGFIIEGREQKNEQTKPTLKEKMAKAKQTVVERKASQSAHNEPCKER